MNDDTEKLILQELRMLRDAVNKLDERFAGFELRQHHDMRAINATFQRLSVSDALLGARVDELLVRVERLEAKP